MDRWCFSFSCYLMMRGSAEASVSSSDGCSGTHMVSPKLLKMNLRVLFTEGITDVKNLGRL